jgi:hypothetical protein
VVLFGLFTLVALSLAGVFVVANRVTAPTTTPKSVTFTDPTNHFSATYRGNPSEKSQTTAVGNRSIREVLWTYTLNSDTSEIVGYADFPTDFAVADPNNALDGSVNGEVRNSHGSLVSKKFGTYQGFKSVDALISASGVHIETRTVLAGRTLYVIVVTSLHNPPELFADFANSLHVLNHVA